MTVIKTTIDTAELQLSGRLTQPQGRSRGLVVALHGGTYDSAYYDGGADSLLELGALLGYTVVAIDRPGYGRSAGCAPELLTFAAQTRVLAEAVDQLAERHSPNRSVLIGHSIGGMLALRVASETRVPLAGVEVSGLGERWQPGLREMWASLIGDAPEVSVPAEAHAQVMFGPAGTFDPEQITRDRDLLRPMPMPELVDVVDWSHAL
ncbi:MAG TPA: alpha/beta fold hydrolase, partial [Aldersonia sp.]